MSTFSLGLAQERQRLIDRSQRVRFAVHASGHALDRAEQLISHCRRWR
jgi:hypothetical protein